jgi:CYTH domain-containing protein/predicted ATPase
LFGNAQLIEPVTMIVLTGGPCSGKSSSLAYLTERLSDHGFMVFVIPETATLITNSGIDRRKMDKSKQVVLYEEAIFDMQMAFEGTYQQAVKGIFPDRKKVILLDRGIMDIKAFISPQDFRAILKRKGLTEMDVRDRYTGIIHLVTAAEGAREYYTGENNEARLESPDEAIGLDQRIRESWLGHPRFRLIDNSTGFEEKIMRAFGAISRLLGVPAPLRKKERFLVEGVDYDRMAVHQVVEIEQVHLRSRNKAEEIRIRKRAQDGASLYFLTRTRLGEPPIEQEELVGEQQYYSLVKRKDPKTEAILKDRLCFLWNDRYFELDRYKGRHEGLAILEVEPSENLDDEAGTMIPPFIHCGRNITGNSRYSDRSMARSRKIPATG